jgi:predicted small secreted protein
LVTDRLAKYFLLEANMKTKVLIVKIDSYEGDDSFINVGTYTDKTAINRGDYLPYTFIVVDARTGGVIDSGYETKAMAMRAFPSDSYEIVNKD